MAYFLRSALNAHRKYQGKEEMDALEFLNKAKAILSELGLDDSFLKRSINDGFSGGEKKKSEILQLLTIDPKLAVLDETDSGLDVDALRTVAKGVNKFKNENNSVLIITHYQRLLDYIKPHVVHLMIDGQIVKTGDMSLVNLFKNDTSDRRIASFNIFHFEEGSQTSIIEKDINEGAPSFNLKMNKFICDNASNLNFAKYVEGKSDCHLLSYSYYKVGKDVCLNMDSMNKDAIFSKEFIEIDLNNTGSDAKVNILNLVKDEQHLDNNILINHNAEHCTSFQHVRNILDNKSSTVFNGKVIVAEGAQQTDSNQSNKNLLLSLNSTAFSNPQLEIYADDVSCGHGSTTGALDENSIFYLRARGIDQSSAQKMLIKAFAKEVIDEFSLSSVQDISEIALDRWING